MAELSTTALTTHELLLALAGRVDDDLLAICRELIAVGDDAPAFELLTAALVAAHTQVPPRVRETLVAAAARLRIDLDADRRLPVAAPENGTPHRFAADSDAPGLGARVAEALAAHRPGGGHSWLTWRTTPAGAAPGPVPHPVLLVEIPGTPGPEDHAADVLAYRLSATLQRIGLSVGVEVFVAGSALPAYHAEALSTARPVPSPAPAAPITDQPPMPPATGRLASVPVVSGASRPMRPLRPVTESAALPSVQQPSIPSPAPQAPSSPPPNPTNVPPPGNPPSDPAIRFRPPAASGPPPVLPTTVDPAALARPTSAPTGPIETSGARPAVELPTTTFPATEPAPAPRRRRAAEPPDGHPAPAPTNGVGRHGGGDPSATGPRPTGRAAHARPTPEPPAPNGAPSAPAAGAETVESAPAGAATERPTPPEGTQNTGFAPPAAAAPRHRERPERVGFAPDGPPAGARPLDPRSRVTPAETGANGHPVQGESSAGPRALRPPNGAPAPAATDSGVDPLTGPSQPVTDPEEVAPDGPGRTPPGRPEDAPAAEDEAHSRSETDAHDDPAPPPGPPDPAPAPPRTGPYYGAPARTSPDSGPGGADARTADRTADDPLGGDDGSGDEGNRPDRVLRVVRPAPVGDAAATPFVGIPARGDDEYRGRPQERSEDGTDPDDGGDPPLLAEMNDPLLGPLRQPLLDPLLEPTGSFRAITGERADAAATDDTTGDAARTTRTGAPTPPSGLVASRPAGTGLPRRSSHAARFARPFATDGETAAVSGDDLFAESSARPATTAPHDERPVDLDPADPLGVGGIVPTTESPDGGATHESTDARAAAGTETPFVEPAPRPAPRPARRRAHVSPPAGETPTAPDEEQDDGVVDPMSTLTATERDLLRLLQVELAAREGTGAPSENGAGKADPPDLAG
ncbi:hypothetical protein [Pseudonocardia dioxanivorans]|uniref:hypothetical protein n=1 Tax=Pseudonocardia dioxanivorans TaxID=240495 RepID=UPI000D033FB4|nr:hypothetical protein [Pseudonocardia dioxanivorans]